MTAMNDDKLDTIIQELKLLTRDVGLQRQELKDLTHEVGLNRQKLEQLSHQVERQGRQLSSLESFPMFPQDIRPSSAYKVTSSHSCSQPKRVRIGYSG